MTLSDDQYKDLIVLQVGDNADGLLAANIDLLWEGNGDQADAATQALYTKRSAIDLMLGDVRQKVDFRDPAGISANLSDLFDHLMRMRADVVAQIALAASSGNGAGAVGTITKTAPVEPDIGQLDPSARRYRGDPLCPPRRRWP